MGIYTNSCSPDNQKSKKQIRDEAVFSHMPLIKEIAQNIQQKLPAGIDLETLLHEGIVGFLEAFEKYDPTRGVELGAYARPRITGQIIEFLRSLDLKGTRKIRSLGRKIDRARQRVETLYARQATDEEIAEVLGISLAEYHKTAAKTDTRIVSMHDAEYQEHKIQDIFSKNPAEIVENRDLIEKLASVMELLPDKLRLVITLYHYKELTFQEIAELLGVTEGRICQIYGDTIVFMRQLLENNNSLLININAHSFRTLTTIVSDLEELLSEPSLNLEQDLDLLLK